MLPNLTFYCERILTDCVLLVVTYNGQCGVAAVERKDDDDTFLQRIVGGEVVVVLLDCLEEIQH